MPVIQLTTNVNVRMCLDTSCFELAGAVQVYSCVVWMSATAAAGGGGRRGGLMSVCAPPSVRACMHPRRFDGRRERAQAAASHLFRDSPQRPLTSFFPPGGRPQGARPRAFQSMSPASRPSFSARLTGAVLSKVVGKARDVCVRELHAQRVPLLRGVVRARVPALRRTCREASLHPPVTHFSFHRGIGATDLAGEHQRADEPRIQYRTVLVHWGEAGRGGDAWIHVRFAFTL